MDFRSYLLHLMSGFCLRCAFCPNCILAEWQPDGCPLIAPCTRSCFHSLRRVGRFSPPQCFPRQDFFRPALPLIFENHLLRSPHSEIPSLTPDSFHSIKCFFPLYAGRFLSAISRSLSPGPREWAFLLLKNPRNSVFDSIFNPGGSLMCLDHKFYT